MSPYNTAGLISEDSEVVATQIATNCHRRQPHSHLIPPPRGTLPMNIPINLIFLKKWNHWPTFLSPIVWVYLHSNLCSGLQRHIFSATECVLAVQGHPRSMILVPIESAYATSY